MDWIFRLGSVSREELAVSLDDTIRPNFQYAENMPTFGMSIVDDLHSDYHDGFSEPGHIHAAGFVAHVTFREKPINAEPTGLYLSIEDAKRVYSLLDTYNLVGKEACKSLGCWRRANAVYNLIQPFVLDIGYNEARQIAETVSTEIHRYRGAFGADVPVEDALKNSILTEKKAMECFKRVNSIVRMLNPNDYAWHRSIAQLLPSVIVAENPELPRVICNAIHRERSCGLADQHAEGYVYSVFEHVELAGYNKDVCRIACDTVRPIATFMATRLF